MSRYLVTFATFGSDWLKCDFTKLDLICVENQDPRYWPFNFFNSVNKKSKPLDKNCRIIIISNIMAILQFLSGGFEVLFMKLKKFWQNPGWWTWFTKKILLCIYKDALPDVPPIIKMETDIEMGLFLSPMPSLKCVRWPEMGVVAQF